LVWGGFLAKTLWKGKEEDADINRQGEGEKILK